MLPLPLPFDSCVQKVQLPKELDVDFGCFFPTDIKGYTITVGFEQFLLLIPNMRKPKSVIQDIMAVFFKDEKYQTEPVTDEEIGNFETNKYHLPILSYDPNTLLDDKISFFWLIPPISLRQ